jgi:transcriptional regulator with XRE-family HTH domain
VSKSPLKPVTLKELAAILELSQSTVSRIVNGAATAHRIATETQERVLHAAALYGYSANTVAKSLRQKRTFTIGVIVPEISEGYSTGVLSGIEDELLKDDYFYFVVSHRHRDELREVSRASSPSTPLLKTSRFQSLPSPDTKNVTASSISNWTMNTPPNSRSPTSIRSATSESPSSRDRSSAPIPNCVGRQLSMWQRP